MMTKEEVAAIVTYCQEDKVSYKQRLAELDIRPWHFYDAKRKYAPREEGQDTGEFLQLVPGGNFLPNPLQPSRSRSARQKSDAAGTATVSIELRTATGTMMRISGNLTGRQIQEIIIASSAHV
jgi:hypothetical protein